MASTSEGERRDYNRLVALLHHQRRAIAALEAENRELARKLNDLRRGVGITVAIHGQTMSLTSPVVTVVSQSTEAPDPGITGTFPTMAPNTPESDSGRAGEVEPPHRPDRPTNGSFPASRVGFAHGSREYRRPSFTPQTPNWLQDEAGAPQWPPLNTPSVPHRRSSSGYHPADHPMEAPKFSTLSQLTRQHPRQGAGEVQRRRPLEL